MGFISFSKNPDVTWHTRSWAFRQLLDDVVLGYPTDSELRDSFEKAKAYDGLSTYLLPVDLASRATLRIRLTAQSILDDGTNSALAVQKYGDDETQEQYRKSLQTLCSIIPKTI